jgi:hypothetical protein
MNLIRNLLSAHQPRALALLPRSSREQIGKPTPLLRSKIPFPKLLLFKNSAPAFLLASTPLLMQLVSNVAVPEK